MYLIYLQVQGSEPLGDHENLIESLTRYMLIDISVINIKADLSADP